MLERMAVEETISDSEWLAEMSMRALAEGRIELALALLRLTLQVRRVERDSAMAPAVPVVPGLVPAPRAAERARNLPRAQVLTVVGNGAPGPDEAPTEVTPSTRCIAKNASGGECHGVLYWVSDDQAGGGWAHLDPRHDNGHQPIADQPRPVHW